LTHTNASLDQEAYSLQKCNVWGNEVGQISKLDIHTNTHALVQIL
jgi:hypothetical protein